MATQKTLQMLTLEAFSHLSLPLSHTGAVPIEEGKLFAVPLLARTHSTFESLAKDEKMFFILMLAGNVVIGQLLMKILRMRSLSNSRCTRARVNVNKLKSSF